MGNNNNDVMMFSIKKYAPEAKAKLESLNCRLDVTFVRFSVVGYLFTFHWRRPEAECPKPCDNSKHKEIYK